MVFKCQYFRNYSRKTKFLSIASIFSRAITQSFIYEFLQNFACCLKMWCSNIFVIWHIYKYVYLYFCYISLGGHLGFWSIIIIPQLKISMPYSLRIPNIVQWYQSFSGTNRGHIGTTTGLLCSGGGDFHVSIGMDLYAYIFTQYYICQQNND